MRLLLKRAARINCKAGEIVEVSPEQAAFLLSVGAAVPIQKDERETVVRKPETRKGPKK